MRPETKYAKSNEGYVAYQVFLVGDAAHRITPKGGTGMNTAIHDAYDLGWKLGWVLRNWATPDLLDTFQRERRPVGLRRTAQSAQEDSSRSVTEEFKEDLGGRVPHAWVHRGDNLVSTLDLIGPGLTLFTGPLGLEWLDAAASMETSVPSRLKFSMRVQPTLWASFRRALCF